LIVHPLPGPWRLKGHLAALLCLTVLLLCCSRTREEPFLLLEGKGWEGKFSLGDSGEKVVRLLGKAPKQEEDKNWRYCDYDFAEIMVDLKSGEISSILLRQSWKTTSGISTGDPVDKILSTYGQIPYRPPILGYPQRGISFVLAPAEMTDSDGLKRPGWVAVWARIYKPQR
jgi:hypothetical protein